MDMIFLFASALLFSSSFVCNKMFQKTNGTGVRSSFEHIFLGALTVCISMPIISGGKLEFTFFSTVMASIYALNNFALTYFGIKSFKYANLSVYSMFMMLGSILIPSTFGMIFYDEKLTFTKAICFVFIFISLFLSINKAKSDKRAIIYYILVFTLNGMAGVISKIHQSFTEINVSTNGFLFASGVIRFAVSACVLCVIYVRTKQRHPTIKACMFSLGGGALNAIGNYLNLFALITIPVMVHSVVTTGLVLVGSALIGLFIKEKITVRHMMSLAFALAATVFSVL